MKKSKKVLLSAAIAAAIMGSVSLPQIQAAEIGSGVNLKATSSGVPAFGGYDVKTTDKNLDTTLATQEGLRNVNSELKDIKDNMKDSLDKAAQATNKANSAANDAQVAADKATNNAQMASDAANDAINAADKANHAADKANQATNKANSAANDAQVAADKATNNAQMASDAANDAINAADKANHAADNIKSDLDKKVDKTKYNWDKAQTNAAVQETKDNLNTFKNEQAVNNQAQRKDIEQNKKDIKANAAAADKAQKTADSKVDQSKYNWDKAQTNAAVQETKDNLNTFKNEQAVNNQAQRKDIEQNKKDIKANAAAADKAQKTADGAQKDATKANDKADAALKVTGNGVLYNHATNLTDGVNQNTLAAEKNAKDIENETNNRVAADTVLSNRITENSSAIQSLRHDVSDLGTEIDNVGAISAALAGLHPLDWNGSGSKFQLSAAAGTYDGKQAMALGGFYHPNRNMLLSLGVSSSLGSDRKTAGNVGITFRVGKGSNGTVSDDVAERLAAMDQKISQLESQNQKLTSILAIVDPSLTKEFPDVPANHWAYEAVSKLAGNGIVEGYPDGDFHGDRTMTRYEMAQVIYKALKKGGTVDQKLVKEFNKEIEAVKANDAQ